MNRLLHRDVDLYYVNAEACDLDTVYLRRRKCLCRQQVNMSVMPDAAPTFIEPDIYGRVERSVVAVLRAIHARRDAEMEQRRKELDSARFEEQQRIMAECSRIRREVDTETKSRWNKLFKGKETHE